MADEKISELDAKVTLHDTDLVPIVDIEDDPDQTKKITGANLKSQVLAGHKDLTTGVHGVGTGTITPSTTAAITLYVDAGAGNDSNAGTSGSPKATIKGALDSLSIVIAHACTICVRGQQTYAESNVALEFSRFTTLSTITIKTVNSSDEDMYDNGVADAGGGNDELVDAAKAWTDDQFNGAYVWIYRGTGAGQVREISDTVDASNKVVVTVNWTTNPDATSYYAIGGGALMSGTDSQHVRNIGKRVNVYGFRHTGATHTDLRVDSHGISDYRYNYCATSVRGILIAWASIIGEPKYNYIAATTAGFDVSSTSYSAIRANVITGATIGVRIYYNSLVAMSAGITNLNHIMNCTTGIKIESDSGCVSASAQSFGAGGDANTADIDPAVSTTVPQWFT